MLNPSPLGISIPSTSNNFFLIVSEITNDFKMASRLVITFFNLIELVSMLLIVVSSVTFNTTSTATNNAFNSARVATVPSTL